MDVPHANDVDFAVLIDSSINAVDYSSKMAQADGWKNCADYDGGGIWAAVPLPEPDFFLDGGSLPCYYGDTVAKLLAAAEAAANEIERLPRVLDVCCGSRAFWFDKQDRRAVFVDARSGIFERSHSDRPRSPVVVSPDWQGSFTDLPFSSGSFDHVVFDPPHILASSASGNVAKYYGVLDDDWREVIARGFAECFRVLRPGGTLIFKWSEVSVSVNEVLALTPEKPLYGHKSSKSSHTHWVAFWKAA